MAVAVSMANDGRDVHPFFIPKANIGHSAENGFSGNNKHRKRQRTESPYQEPTTRDPLKTAEWVDPLNVISSRTLLISNATSKSSNHEGNSSIDMTTETRKGRGSHGRNLSVRDGSQNCSSTGSPHRFNEGLALAKEVSQSAGSNSNEDTVKNPPKKMLTVRSDGKLRSPKAKAPAQDVKPKRGRKPAKAEILPKTLVTSTKYGADAQSRSSVGLKIANILSGTASNTSPAKAKPSKPIDPPKPTHPFFLGGSKRDQCQQGLAKSKDNQEVRTGDHSTTKKQEAPSLIKARVTSKPPGMSERSAGGLGSGNTTFPFDHVRRSRFPGALEPLWPPKGMVHVREDHKSAEICLPPSYTPRTPKIRTKINKMKEAEKRIPKEDQILTRYVDVTHAYRNDDGTSRRVHSREWREFRRPLRRIVTGCELQQAVCGRIESKLPIPYPDLTVRQDEDSIGFSQVPQSPLHPAISHMYNGIASSLTAFDKFEWETQEWVHKYAPASANHVLQAGPEALILRDWLKTLTINSVGSRAVDTSKTRDSSVSSRRATTKRKRRRAEELEGFVVSSDEEANEMCQLTKPVDPCPTNLMQKKSVIRARDVGNSSNRERVSNAVVISGPHGCGKTAAVRAVARELGFEVFEINAGSRRSGRDILDKVGDMTRNHLVQQGSSHQGADLHEDVENLDLLSAKLKQDLDSGRQGTMNAFLKSKGAPKKSPSKRKPKTQKASSKQDPPRKTKSQQQSLILLEEVDIIFDEDKTFWATTLDLLVQSKRPIIMTCTDETLLPLEDMMLHAILRFTHAPEQLATDYLLLVACNEGHMLPRDAVVNLYKSKGFDLRASMTELNFFCQMAVGDTKGGLEWMLVRPPSTDSSEQTSKPFRVVSEDTYQIGIGLLSSQHQTSLAELSLDQETELLSGAWDAWGLDVGACWSYISPSATHVEASRTLALHQLQDFERVAEALSATDTFPGRPSMSPDTTSFDTTQPELTEKARSNYVEGYSLLQADPIVDQTGVTEAIPVTLRACARRFIQFNDTGVTDNATSNEKMIYTITENMQDRTFGHPNTKFCHASVFEPIARSTKPVLGIPKGPQISTFDGSLSVITEDLAPYVRSIVAYDLRLEEHRGLLSSLLSRPGQNSKRQRTTRASRAALEGGSKARTRRERWFPNNTNFDAVLRSGGQGWQDIALKQSMAESSEGETGLDESSRRDSVASASASAMEGDI